MNALSSNQARTSKCDSSRPSKLKVLDNAACGDKCSIGRTTERRTVRRIIHWYAGGYVGVEDMERTLAGISHARLPDTFCTWPG